MSPATEDLFASADAQGESWRFLDDELARALTVAREDRVLPRDDAAFRRELGRYDFALPQPLDEAVRWVIGALGDGLTQTTSPRYYGLFNGRASLPSEVGDRIAAAFNPQLSVWSHAPAAVEIERHTITAVAQRLGMGAAAGGHFTSGGSEANYTGLLCALTRAGDGFDEHGARAFAGAPRVYASRDSHLAWLKIAHQAGVGRSAIRLIATDGRGRMDANALRRAIEADIAAGDVPVMIAATAGTTNAGAVDPLGECRALADQHGLWLHVDGAWGGGLIASSRARTLIDGIERADSVTIDAHKWLAATMGTGMFLARDAKLLARVFRVAASYMPASDPGLDPYVNSVQWSRRFAGIRLFMTLATAGWDGLGQHIDRCLELSTRLEARLRANGWSVVNDPGMAVVCALPPPGSAPVERIIAALHANGRHWCSKAMFEDRAVVRACITNSTTSETDVDALVAELCAHAGEALMRSPRASVPSP
jgi:glutamate/tyrosine decarboxylase-like PLP-dependent enzyme